jgi:hypothetical protein
MGKVTTNDLDEATLLRSSKLPEKPPPLSAKESPENPYEAVQLIIVISLLAIVVSFFIMVIVDIVKSIWS